MDTKQLDDLLAQHEALVDDFWSLYSHSAVEDDEELQLLAQRINRLEHQINWLTGMDTFSVPPAPPSVEYDDGSNDIPF